MSETTKVVRFTERADRKCLAGLRRNNYVVITAASSSMGVAAIQMSKAIGAKCIAVTRSETKKEALLGIRWPA